MKAGTKEFTVPASQVAQVGNTPATSGDAGDTGLVPGLGGSLGGGNGNPLQYFCLENPMDSGDQWATYSP